MRPLFVMTAFWGPRFRSYFSNYCLRSLLAPGNLGSLSAQDGHKLLVCTTAEDWKVLSASPVFAGIAAHATPQWVEIGFPEEKPNPVTAKFRHMSFAHRLLADIAYEHRALTSLIMPDSMYSDGTLATAVRYCEGGAHAVLAFGPRMIEEELFSGLRQTGMLPDISDIAKFSGPISISSRHIVKLAIKSLFWDSRNCELDAPHFSKWPSYFICKRPDGDGLLAHSFYHWYVLMDFAAIGRHETRAFENAAIENSWLADNFQDVSRIHVLQSADEGMVLSWTPYFDNMPPKKLRATFYLPIISAMWKGFRLRRMREFNSLIGDFQKANAIRHPIRWQTGEPDITTAAEVESRRVMLWFFGDAFEEFAEGLPGSTLILLHMWWFVMRSAARLSARAYVLIFASRRKLKRIINLSMLRSVSRLKSSQ